MLAIGRRKGVRAGAEDRLTFVEADAQQLPFPDDYFQIVAVAFGLRNVADTDRGLREMVRVCRPGGRVAVLEFAMPRRQPWRGMYRWYFRRVLPRIGQLLARNGSGAYKYLPVERRRVSQRSTIGRSDASGRAERSGVFAADVRSGDVVRGEEGARGEGLGTRDCDWKRAEFDCGFGVVAGNEALCTSNEQIAAGVGHYRRERGRYAVRLLEVLLAAGCDVYLSISPAGQAVLKEELGLTVDLDDFRSGELADRRNGASRQNPCTAAASRRKNSLLPLPEPHGPDRQRFVSDGRNGRVPLLRQHAGRD